MSEPGRLDSRGTGDDCLERLLASRLSLSTHAPQLVDIQIEILATEFHGIGTSSSRFDRPFVIRIVRLEYDRGRVSQKCVRDGYERPRCARRDDEFEGTALGIKRNSR